MQNQVHLHKKVHSLILVRKWPERRRWGRKRITLAYFSEPMKHPPPELVVDELSVDGLLPGLGA